MPESNYKVFRDDSGRVDAINRVPDGATVPTWDANDPITIAYHDWLEQNPEFDTSDHPAQPEATADENMLGYRIDMLSNPGYLRVTLAAAASPQGMLLVTRLEAALTFEKPHWKTVQALWGQILGTLSILAKPTASEVAAWNTIAQNRNITAIAFAANGQITLR